MEDLRFKGKTVGILGFGVEGRSAMKYYLRHGAQVTVVDEADKPIEGLPEGVEQIVGTDALNKIENFDIVSRTPPLRPDRIHTKAKVSSSTIEFFDRCMAPIIAVTGTKGKGTTSTLIAKILEEDGNKVHLVGNIGLPALDVLDEIDESDYVVYEISSFQLWDLKKGPQVAVVLMITEDHLDVHESIDEYIMAKSNIANYQTADDLIVVNADNELSQRVAADSPAQSIDYNSDTGASIRGDDIIIDEQRICSVGDIGLLGKHNLENILAAISACWFYTQNVEVISKVVQSFKGLEHRLEFVALKKGVKYYNDSFSASPVAASAASEIFGDKSIMIYGGKDKGLDYCKIAETANDQKVKKAILIGDIAEKLSKCFDDIGFDRYEIVRGDMNEIVKKATASSSDGDVVILSPGSSSFDMFKNYKDRGEQFRQAVSKL